MSRYYPSATQTITQSLLVDTPIDGEAAAVSAKRTRHAAAAVVPAKRNRHGAAVVSVHTPAMIQQSSSPRSSGVGQNTVQNMVTNGEVMYQNASSVESSVNYS